MGVPPHIRAWTMQKEIVASISSMVVTISRLHNITASIGLMRKIASLARDYANGRAAFSQNLRTIPCVCKPWLGWLGCPDVPPEDPNSKVLYS